MVPRLESHQNHSSNEAANQGRDDGDTVVDEVPLLSNGSAHAKDQVNQNAIDQEVKPLSGYSSDHDPTPRFGETNWFTFIGSCLLTITLLSVWQNAGKVAVSVHLASGQTQGFHKPMLLTLTHFVGLALYAPFSGWQHQKWNARLLQKIGLSSLMATMTFLFLTNALSFLPLSTTIIIRMGGLTFFTALGSYAMGKIPLDFWMILAITVVVAGVVVSCIPLLSVESSKPTEAAAASGGLGPAMEQAVGVLCALLSAAMASGRAVSEEIIFADEKQLSPIHFATISCLFSASTTIAMMSVAQVLPGPDGGVQEDSRRTVATVVANPAVAAALAVAVGSAMAYQICDKVTVKKYGAATTKVFAAFQIVPSWAIAICLYYVFRGHGIGEAWDWQTATYKLVGGVVVLSGNELFLRSKRAAESRHDPTYDPVK